jgi:peptide/nickel transport system ATP-binding protein
MIAALDASIQAEVLNLLDALRRDHGLTYVLVSHDLAVVAHMCERLIVMQHGREVEELTRDALQGRQAQKAYTRNLLAASEGFKSKETRDDANPGNI